MQLERIVVMYRTCRVVAGLCVCVSLSSSSCVCVVVFVVARLAVWLGMWLGGAFEIVQFGGTFRIVIGRRDHSY